MATLEELRRRKAQLLAKEQIRRDFMNIQRERDMLKKEIKELKNPRTERFKRNLSKGLSIGGRATFRFLDNITRPAPIRRPMKKSVKRKRRR